MLLLKSFKELESALNFVRFLFEEIVKVNNAFILKFFIKILLRENDVKNMQEAHAGKNFRICQKANQKLRYRIFDFLNRN